MSNKNYNISSLAQNIQEGVKARLKDLHTAMPGIIETFNPAMQTATVQPAVKRIFKTVGSDSVVLAPADLPVLINVPVVQPRGGGYSLTFPIAPGDECLLVFCERSIDIWHEKSGPQMPGAKRFHALSDATAYVGLSSKPNKVPDYDPDNVQLKKDDGTASVTIKPNQVDVDAKTLVQVTAPTISLIGDVTITGSLYSNGADFEHNGTNVGDDHTHEGSPTAPSGAVSDTGGPV